MVVYGADGLDELSTTGPSAVLEVGADAEVRRYTVDPADLGFAPATLDDLRGGDVDANAEVVRQVLAGEKGPHRDVAVLNAAAGLVVAGVCADLAEGVTRAGAVIDEGAARDVLENLARTSQEAARATS